MFYLMCSESFIAMENPTITSLPVNPLQGTAGQEVTAYEAMSSLVNYIQPNKFISFDNAKSGSSLKTKQDKSQVKVFKWE